MKVSMDKKYEIRGGEMGNLPVKIYSVEGNVNDSVHGAVLIDGKWRHMAWNKNGILCNSLDDAWDLVEVKERKKVEGWVNVYSDMTIGIFCKTKLESKEIRSDRTDVFACVKVTIDCEQGEGL
jgi:hypothetical protein